MPEITESEIRNRLSRTGPYFVTENSHRTRYRQYKSGEKIRPEHLENFLLTVHSWHILCFDTESDGKTLRYKVGHKTGELGRTPVVFGNPAGQVLIFHDARDVPTEIVKICENFAM